MNRPLKLLVIEDDPADFLLLKRQLEKDGIVSELCHVASNGELEAALAQNWDAVLADYNVPGMDFHASLARIRALQSDLPVILVSGSVGEETAIDLLNAGVYDFVLKSRIARLGPVLRRCLEKVEEQRACRVAETALRESEAQYRAVIETASDGFWMLDGEGQLLAVNEAYVRRSGYSRKELLAMRIDDLEAQESPDDVRRHIEKVRRDGSDLFETWHRAKDGEVWPVEVNASYWAAAGGRFFGFMRDLTERRQTEAALQSAQVEMEQLMRFHVAQQTVAAIAHELNQPLVAISSYSEAALRLLRAGNQHPEKLFHALESNVEQAHRAGRVVRELLTFLNKSEVETGPVDLNEIVRKVVGALRRHGHGEFETRLELETRLPHVSANRLQIEKVLANLIQNGLDAMRAARSEAQLVAITVRTLSGTGLAQLTVRDSGPGVGQEIQHRIFDPFFTTKPNGLGMGLAVSRAVVEAHGGQLWVESDPGLGASFHFTLPFAP